MLLGGSPLVRRIKPSQKQNDIDRFELYLLSSFRFFQIVTKQQFDVFPGLHFLRGTLLPSGTSSISFCRSNGEVLGLALAAQVKCNWLITDIFGTLRYVLNFKIWPIIRHLAIKHEWNTASESTAPPAVGCSRRSSPPPPCGCRPPCTCGRPEAAHWSCTGWPGPGTCCWLGWPGTPGSASCRSTSTSGWV